jgi:vacuole morphology and inheritance protein 14
MSKHITCSKSCMLLADPSETFQLTVRSADLEMTVNTLIQIDKLVQLLESPVFTCKLHEHYCCDMD